MEHIKEEVAKGSGIAEAMRKSSYFPVLLVSMVGVGEEGGTLPDMLDKIVEIYEGEVENAVATLLSLIEPAMIVFLGGIIGTIVVCLFLPILQLSQLIRK